MAPEQTKSVVAAVARIIRRELADGESALLMEAVASGNASTIDALSSFLGERDRAFAGAITTGHYIDVMLDAAKRVGTERAQRIIAREESSPYFLVGNTRDRLEEVSLLDLTPTAEPHEAEIIAALRDILRRRRATGCVVLMDSTIYLEDEVEPSTGEQRRMEVLFGIAIARGGNRSVLLPLDGGMPVWHDFTGVATGLERYTELSSALVELA